MQHLIQQSLTSYQAGQLQQTKQLCQDILSIQPDHSETMHLLGVTLARIGQPKQALPWLQKAIAISPSTPLLHVNLGNVYLETHDFDNAIKSYRHAISLDPKQAQAYNCLGAALERQEQFEPALNAFKKAIDCAPAFAPPYANLGILLVKHNLFKDAEAPLRKSIELAPTFADAYIRLGQVCAATNRPGEAIACYEKAITINPRLGEAYYHIAEIFMKQNQEDRARQYLLKFLTIQPTTASECLATASALNHLHRHDEALAMAKKAIAMEPQNPVILMRAAVFEKTELQLDDAQQHLEKALAIWPRFTQALNALAGVAELQNRFGLAINYYTQAIDIDPHNVDAHLHRGLARLMIGDFENGWEDYEWRWRSANFTSPKRDFTWPLWEGQPLQGKTILIHQEQGFGDGIQFARYAPLLAQAGATVLMEADPALRTILQTVPGVSHLYDRGSPLPQVDYHCPFMSLPRAFKTRPDNIPTNIPYITPQPEKVRFWQNRLAQEPAKLRVGLVWAGKSQQKNDRNRSIELASFAPLAKIPDVVFYSLQKGPAQTQIHSPPPEMKIIDCAHQLETFADTAALIAALDLLITVDSAPVHLAGAMNNPSWVMVPYNCDWRWPKDRNDSPWYPSLRLFRQTQHRNWKPVIEQLVQALTIEIANR